MRQTILDRVSATLGVALTSAVLVFGLSQAASAMTLSYTLDFSFGDGSCGGGGGGTTCWVGVTWDDGGSPGTVDMTLDASGLPAGTSLSEFYFNSDTAISFSGFTPLAGSSMTGAFSLTSGPNCCQADGDGLFDNFLNLPPPGADLFDGGEQIVFHLNDLGGGGITANTFDSTAALSNYFAAARIEQTGTANSDWLGADGVAPIPEPNAAILFGVGAGVVGVALRRRSSTV